MATKKCKGKCGEVKEASKLNFNSNYCHADNLSDICKVCASQAIKDKYKERKKFNEEFGIV